MALAPFAEQILKTGFPLEFSVTSALRKKGWFTISNKYYIDDHDETVREIDIVAYKVTSVDGVFIYTVIVVSCKKSEGNSWVFLARPVEQGDPNRDWNPLNVWTNDKPLLYQTGLPEFNVSYYKSAQTRKVKILALEDPEVDIFAFQEMNRQSGAPQNDRGFFSSITSLMKAQSYEIGALKSRKKDRCLYCFSLLTVVDAEMIRLNFSENEIDVVPIKSELYVASYIVNKAQNLSRIRFVNVDDLVKCIADYDRLHRFNCSAFGEARNTFFDGIVEDIERRDVLLDDFKSAVLSRLRLRIVKDRRKSANLPNEISIGWTKKSREVSVYLDTSEELVDFLNNDTDAVAITKSAFESVYRYAGKFVFEADLPF